MNFAQITERSVLSCLGFCLIRSFFWQYTPCSSKECLCGRGEC